MRQVFHQSGDVEATDWRTIAALYADLESVAASPVTTLNRAVAVGRAEGPDAALALLATVEEPLRDYHLLHAARGDLLLRVGTATTSQE